jgi:hypothetical protein
MVALISLGGYIVGSGDDTALERYGASGASGSGRCLANTSKPDLFQTHWQPTETSS